MLRLSELVPSVRGPCGLRGGMSCRESFLMPCPGAWPGPVNHLRLYLNMDLRPHRRLVIPFSQPLFSGLADVSEFFSSYFEHFGVAKFSADMFANTTFPILRRMCDSMGNRLFISCGDDGDAAIKAVIGGADFVSVSKDFVHSVVSAASGFPKCTVFTTSCLIQEVEEAVLLPSNGLAVPFSLVSAARARMPDAVVFTWGAPTTEIAQAVKDGASLVEVPPDVVMSPDPRKALRDLSEEYRKHT